MSDPSRWEELQRTWQQPPDLELPDVEKLLAKRTRAIWAWTALDVVFSLAVIAWAISIVRGEATPSELGLAVFLAVLLALGWAGELWIRRGTWRLDAAAPAAMVDLSIRRCRASIRLALFNQWVILGALALGLVFRGFLRAHVAFPDLGIEDKTLLRIGGLLFLGAWLAAAEWYKRRKRAELARLEILRDELED